MTMPLKLSRPMLFRLAKRSLAFALVFLLLDTPQLLAQAAAIAGAQAAAPKELHIVILEGEDALNNIRQRTAREPIVQVEDENHKPVAGVLILFSIHGGAGGAGGTFAGASTLSVTTGADGQATATGFTPNAIKGKYQITVTATLGALTTSSSINENNSDKSDENSQSVPVAPQVLKTHHVLGKKFWYTVAGVGATGGVIAILLLTGNSGANITAGPGSVHP